MSLLQKWLGGNKRYISNLGATFISQAATALSVLFITPYLVRQLGESSFSFYGVLLNLVLVASVFDFGLNAGLCHRLIQEPHRKNLLINAVFFFSPIVFVFAIPVFFFLFYAGWVANSPSTGLLSIVLALVVTQNMLALQFESILQSVNKIFFSKLLRMGRTVVETCFLYVFSESGDILWLLIASVAVNFVFLIALFLVAKKQLSFNISWSHFKWTALFSQLKYSGWYFASALAAVIAYNVQIVLLGKYLTDTQMATFLLIFRFFEVIRIGMTNFTQVLFPTISMRQASGDWKGIYSNFKMVFLRVFALSLLIFSFIFWKGYDVFVWWSDYYNSESLSTFQVYTLYVFFLVIDHVAVIHLLALKFNKMPAIISILQSVLSLFATIFFIQQIGLAGAVWASLLLFGLTSLIFNPLYLMHQLRKQQAIL
jgi:O-antigen/teichoic acid export membrane protein